MAGRQRGGGNAGGGGCLAELFEFRNMAPRPAIRQEGAVAVVQPSENRTGLGDVFFYDLASQLDQFVLKCLAYADYPIYCVTEIGHMSCREYRVLVRVDLGGRGICKKKS